MSENQVFIFLLAKKFKNQGINGLPTACHLSIFHGQIPFLLDFFKNIFIKISGHCKTSLLKHCTQSSYYRNKGINLYYRKKYVKERQDSIMKPTDLVENPSTIHSKSLRCDKTDTLVLAFSTYIFHFNMC